MPYRPLISKIRVHNPNKRGASSANRNYVKYIATREGVSLESVKDINDLLSVDGMDEKKLSEELIHNEADDDQYLRYIARRPKSHGLFGNIDTDDLAAVSSQIAKLTESGKIIYRGVISLSEKDGEVLGFRNANAWNNYLKSVMPEVAKQLGIGSTNYTWVAAFHAEESHPHVHYMLWNNKDQVKSPYIHKATQQKIRIYLEKEMFDNVYEKTIRQVYEDEVRELNKSRNQERKSMLERTGGILSNSLYAHGTSYERMPGKVPKKYLEKVAQEAEKLISVLPEKGRLNYQFLPSDAKEQLEKITNILFERPDMQSSLHRYLGSVEESHKIMGETKTKIEAELERAERDIKKRICNRILREIKPFLLNDRGEDAFERMEEAERNSVPLEEEDAFERMEEAERNSVPLEEEDAFEGMEEAERNSVPLKGEEKNEFENVTPRYTIQWSEDYKKALNMLLGEQMDIKEAYDILAKEALRGNALGIFKVATLIENELIDIPSEKADEYYDESFKAFSYIYKYPDGKNDWEINYNKMYAAYRIGKLYERGKGGLEIDYDKAKEWYQKAENYKYANYSLAMMYLREKCYVSDHRNLYENQKEAFKLLIDSASSKNPNPFAAYELGKLYQKGIFVQSNEEEANNWYAQAFQRFIKMAKRSIDDSLFYRIGDMYLTGKGVDENLEQGEKFIEKAANLGNDNAKIRLALLYYKKENIELKNKAIEILTEMSEKGNHMAQYKLGYIYGNPEDEERYDIGKAVEYLEKSAEQGNEYAQYKLGCIYADKKTEIYNMEKAVKYFTLSAEQGNQYAQCRVGCIYYFGKDVLKEKELGQYWLQCAAEQGNELACSILESPMIGIDFSYCLLKGALSAMETMNRQATAHNYECKFQIQSKQAAKERYLHRDHEQ